MKVRGGVQGPHVAAGFLNKGRDTGCISTGKAGSVGAAIGGLVDQGWGR